MLLKPADILNGILFALVNVTFLLANMSFYKDMDKTQAIIYIVIASVLFMFISSLIYNLVKKNDEEE
jgi:predicted membrane channel-forming protein YqfA (hemolysin III family)